MNAPNGLANFLELMAKHNRDNDEPRADGIRHDPSRGIPVLRDHLARWDQPNPFAIGDVLTVAPHSSIWKTNAGFVIVRDVFASVIRETDDRHMVISYDMSVLLIMDDGHAMEFSAHSRDFILHEKAAR